MRESQSGGASKNLYLSIDCPVPDSEVSPIPGLEAALGENVSTGDLRRIDTRAGTLEATYGVEMENSRSIADMMDELERAFPGIGITFLDPQCVLGVLGVRDVRAI